MDELKRIRAVYTERDARGMRSMYSLFSGHSFYQNVVKTRMLASSVFEAFGPDLSEIRVLDVGCGGGAFLRSLIELGAAPGNLMGTEFLEDRLSKAALMSPTGITWHLGDLGFDHQDGFDLVTANTVFSSVLDDSIRTQLAGEMWEKLRVGGWVMIFDFRYNNPSNKYVRKVTRQELARYWPARRVTYSTGLLAPPLARRLPCGNYVFHELVTAICPPLRSHFVYMAQK